MSMAAEEARIDHETNHFARETKTTVKSLSKAGILIDKTIQMTRLKSLLGIASYDNYLMNSEEDFSDILTRSVYLLREINEYSFSYCPIRVKCPFCVTGTFTKSD